MSYQNSQRLPAPSLFVGPPSRNASNMDLERAPTNTSLSSPKLGVSTSTTPPLASHSPILQRPSTPPQTRQSTELHRTRTTTTQEGGGGGIIEPEAQPRRRPRRSTAVLDAHWAALQSTLSDIELSASGSAHVFGTEHALALEQLRDAQVELARAWGSSEDVSEEMSLLSKSITRESRTTTSRKEEGRKDKEEKGNVVKDEEQSLHDLNDATKRRDASDAYFGDVKRGVRDVVKKLDAVSKAMRAVELQSRDIWGEGESTTSLGTDSLA